ncbi:MAG: hypothetical protein JWN99_1788, partial [Ilumatobacteraceae bacterium]|nr:hypothetical protein [Ilumatobacteraceae bacterium]
MSEQLDIAFFGSSLVSSWWNGAATYYRGLVRGLADRGHHVRFYEPIAYDRHDHRDMPDPDWAEVIIYPADDADQVSKTVWTASNADIVVKTSGVGVFDGLLEDEVLKVALSSGTAAMFLDVDAP